MNFQAPSRRISKYPRYFFCRKCQIYVYFIRISHFFSKSHVDFTKVGNSKTCNCSSGIFAVGEPVLLILTIYNIWLG